MKTKFTIIGILLSLIGFSQTENDKKILQKYEYGEVYITHDTSRKEYSWFIPENPKEESLYFYKQYYQEIVNGNSFIKYNSTKKNLPVKWNPLFKIDEKYYLYAPSDWMSSYGYIFSDSTIIKQYSDGPDVYALLSAKKISNKKYEFKTLTTNNITTKISIFIIDDQNHIAVWKFVSNKETHYELMVDVDYLKRFPIVVCDCGDTKCLMEYHFKLINFEKLIKNIQ